MVEGGKWKGFVNVNVKVNEAVNHVFRPRP